MVRLTAGRGLRVASCRMEIGNRLDIDESPIHRGCFYRFIGLVTALDCCPGDLTLFVPGPNFFPCLDLAWQHAGFVRSASYEKIVAESARRTRIARKTARFRSVLNSL